MEKQMIELGALDIRCVFHKTPPDKEEQGECSGWNR